MDKRWDVLGIGCVAVDDLFYVAAYPPADVKIPIERRERMCGGLTATALVAAARQGAACAYGGALADDEPSHFVRATLEREGIDFAPSPRHLGASPIHATVIVDQSAHTRTILIWRPEVVGPLAQQPTADDLAAARVLLIDHHGEAATVRAQQLARAAGVPVVADLERDDLPAFAEIRRLTDHLVISEQFAAHLSGCGTPADAARSLLTGDTQVVVVTCGRDGCWAVTADEPAPRHYPSFAVEVVDTTGCGDAFHGVYAAELARGTPLPERLRRAAATAALKARHHGGQPGLPTRAAVDEFLAAADGDRGARP